MMQLLHTQCETPSYTRTTSRETIYGQNRRHPHPSHTLSRRVLKQFRKDCLKGRNLASIFLWKREQISKLTEEEVCNSLILKFNNAAPLPCCERRLIFHHFDRLFYSSDTQMISAYTRLQSGLLLTYVY